MTDNFLSAGLSVWTRTEISSLTSEQLSLFTGQIDNLGRLSGVSQQLNGPITSVAKIMAASESGDSSSSPTNANQTLIIHCSVDDESASTSKVIITGFIKYSYRHLYFYTKKGKVVEKDPCCILDFYVLETIQRKGIGHQLLEHVLAIESDRTGVGSFDQCCYDRPSPKLIAFIKKNYKSTKENLQPNKFMIFDQFINQLG